MIPTHTAASLGDICPLMEFWIEPVDHRFSVRRCLEKQSRHLPYRSETERRVSRSRYLTAPSAPAPGVRITS